MLAPFPSLLPPMMTLRQAKFRRWTSSYQFKGKTQVPAKPPSVTSGIPGVGDYLHVSRDRAMADQRQLLGSLLTYGLPNQGLPFCRSAN